MKNTFFALTIISALIFSAISLAPVAGLASETVKGAKKDFEKFKDDMRDQLATVEKQISDLRKKIETHTTKVTEQTLKDLDHTRYQIRTDMDNLNEDAEGKWKTVKKGLADSMNTLNAKIQKALKN